MRPKYTKPDRVQSQLINDLHRLGAVVWNLSHLGGEVLDIMVFWQGRARPVEIKAPGQEANLTAKETLSIQKLKLVGIEPIVATCLEDILEQW